MHLLITGATGYIGRDITRQCLEKGMTITAYIRNVKKAHQLLGENVTLINSFDDITKDTKFDAVINLAGAPIAGGLWTNKRRQTLRNSRITTTQGLVHLISRLTEKPSVMLSASAAGYYGDGGQERLDEDAPPQSIFMSELCRDWEQAAATVSQYGVRLVILRISPVFSKDGGAFPQLRMPIHYYLGSVFGNGQQYMPWIHKSDLLAMIQFALGNEEVQGPINACAPETVTNRELNRQIATALKRPLWFRAPAFILKLILGEMSDLFLKSQRMSSNKVQDLGFTFRHATLNTALEELIPKS